MMKLDIALQPALEERQRLQRYRQLRSSHSPQQVIRSVGGRNLVSFCSNDYLGLANHPHVIKCFQSAAEEYGVGSGASHLVSGYSTVHHELEEALAEFTQRPRALLFSTGYMANMGVINALLTKRDAVFEDKLNHASLLDGGLISSAKFERFKHSDTTHLQQKLSGSTAARKLIVTDGVFSMDGDLAPLNKLAECANQHDAWLMVDDAHGFGCLGKHGGGVAEHFDLGIDQLPILMGTLGKAFGTFGAFVAGSETLIEYLIQFARTYIYTTALPPAVAAATLASLKIIQEEYWRRDKLGKLIQQFRSGCEALNLQLMDSQTAIQPVVMGSDTSALKASEILMKKGFWVTAIRPPTVPEGSARLRFTFTAEHTEKHVSELLDAMSDLAEMTEISEQIPKAIL